MHSFVLLFCVLLLAERTFAIDLSGCGTTKTCVRSADGCLPTDSACLIFTYSWNAVSNSFSMELSGSSETTSEYVAVAFSPNGLMQDSDVYYCTGTELTSGVIQTRQSAPIANPPPLPVTDVTVAANNAINECSFTRPASVTKTITGSIDQNFDLTITNYNVLLAKGAVGSGMIQYHGTARYNKGSQNYTAPPATTNSETPTNDDNSVTVTGCGTTMGCYQNPASCTPGVSGCQFVSWQYDSTRNRVTFNIVAGGSGQYAGIALGTVERMQDADLYVCMETRVRTGVITANRNPPTLDAITLPDIEDIAFGSSNGVNNCSFSRPISITRTISGGALVEFNVLTTEYYFLIAVGNADASGGVTFHSSQSVSSSRSNFTSTSSSSSSSTSRSRNLLRAHASLMLIAWLTCVSVGALLARHFKPLWHDSKLGGEKVWFQLHRSLMILVVLATIIAFILIFVYVDGYSSAATNPHPIIGIVVTILMIINPIMAIFRPHPHTPRRPIFNWAHWFVGTTARILAIAAIFLGIELLGTQLPDAMLWVMVAFVVFHVIVEVVLEAVSACYGHIAAYQKKNKESYEMNATGGSQPSPPPPPKGAGIKYAILVLYSLVNIGFLIYFLYNIGNLP